MSLTAILDAAVCLAARSPAQQVCKSSDVVVVRRCTVLELEQSPNLDELLVEYAREAAMEGLGPAVPQWWLYRKLEKSGLLHTIGAFVDNVIVGFITVVVMQRPHYEALIASYESYFVAESARQSGAGNELLKAAEQLAKSKGAAGLFVNAAVGSRLDAVLDAKRLYRKTHNVFFKEFK